MTQALKYFFGLRTVTHKLLDLYGGAAVAYSLIQLSNSYSGACIRVRRTSDNAETDIGFVGGVVDTATLLSFAGASSAAIKTWYDQSGNANHATNATNLEQPTIVVSGSLVTIGSKPALAWSVKLTFSSITLNSAWSLFTIGKRNSAGRLYATMCGDQASLASALLHFTDNNYYAQRSGFFSASTATDTSANQVSLTMLAKASSEEIYKNGTTISVSRSASAISNTMNQLGRYGTSNLMGHLQTVILYNSDQSANRSGIETQLNNYYTIF